MKAAMYCPSGEVPSQRGFAPALVIENLVQHFQHFKPVILSAAEYSPCGATVLAGVPHYKFRHSPVYQRVFQKWFRTDPFPLHLHAARWLMTQHPDTRIFHAHQKEINVRELREVLSADCKVVVHSHVGAEHFEVAKGEADLYICVSEHNREVNIGKGYPPDKLVVVANGVDTALFRPDNQSRDSYRQQLGILPAQKVLFFFGRRQEVKGFDLFVQVAEQLLQQHEELVVLVAGATPAGSEKEASFATTQARLQRLVVHPRFHDLKTLNHLQLAQALKAVDVCFLPSRAEPQGMAMLEAMASGCILVSTAVGGIKESVIDGQTGYLLPPDPPFSLAAAKVKEALYTAASQIGQQAVAHINAHYRWELLARQTEALYLSLLDH